AAVGALVSHHLDGDQAVVLLRSLANLGTQLVLINDLDRSRTGLFLAHLAGRVLTRSPVVRIDGPLSVRAAFKPEEALALAEKAGLHGATVRRCWPCRWLLSWGRP